MFYEILKQLCTDNGTTPTALAKKLKLSTSKVTLWKNGTEPSAKYLIAIADYFNVSVDFLLGRKSKNASAILTAHEMQLILAYRTHPEMQKAVDTLLGLDSADNSVQSDIQKTVAAINAATQKEPTVQK